MSAKETVLAYVDAVNTGPEASRALLADNFRYTGPTFSANSADEFMAMLGESAMEVTLAADSVDEAGSVVTLQATLTLTKPVESVIRVCEVFTVADGKISSSNLYFDTNQMAVGPGKG